MDTIPGSMCLCILRYAILLKNNVYMVIYKALINWVAVYFGEAEITTVWRLIEYESANILFSMIAICQTISENTKSRLLVSKPVSQLGIETGQSSGLT